MDSRVPERRLPRLTEMDPEVNFERSRAASLDRHHLRSHPGSQPFVSLPIPRPRADVASKGHDEDVVIRVSSFDEQMLMAEKEPVGLEFDESEITDDEDVETHVVTLCEEEAKDIPKGPVLTDPVEIDRAYDICFGHCYEPFGPLEYVPPNAQFPEYDWAPGWVLQRLVRLFLFPCSLPHALSDFSSFRSSTFWVSR